MPGPNFQTYLMASRALDDLDRAEMEREFTALYERAVASSGAEHAENIARAETHHLLLKGDLDFEGDAFIRSHLH
ncbi:hypothetical protein [Bosea sp. (in: a-proteobacteria)]|uniref:hypothetical protein n=1 Tax=Bosea sp. (in: a-proteobacteria) TaxID=1871050 RepID=UPI004033BB3B